MKQRQNRATAEVLRQKAETLLRMSFVCRDASLSHELRRLADEFVLHAEELEASAKI